MFYYIDGYNLLFTWSKNEKSLQSQRQNLIRWIQGEFAEMSIDGALVFDGAHRRDEESGLCYPSPLVVAYTPKGQTADAYIVERLSLEKKCANITVVTNDRGLQRHAQSFGAKTQSNLSFLEWLFKRKKKKKTKKAPLRETDFHMQRLLKIFEERLQKKPNDELDGWL